MTEVAEARALADRYLASSLPRRWRHVQAAAAQAERVAERLGLPDNTLVAAVWLHDIGYGPQLAETGFHPLDGGRFLRTLGMDDRVVRLVAHHSCAVYEARVRGLDRELLAQFEHEDSVTYDALVYCDMTTGPESVTLSESEGQGRPRAEPPNRPVDAWRFACVRADLGCSACRQPDDLYGHQRRTAWAVWLGTPGGCSG